MTCRRPDSRFVFCFGLLCAVISAGECSPLYAQLEGQIADRPIAVGYARGIGPAQMIEYVKDLTNRLQIGDEFRREIEDESMREQQERMFPKTEHPLYGVAFYMVTGLIPSFETVSFQQVIDEADARRLADGQRQQWGEQGTMTDLGNGCFEVTYRNSFSFELPAGTDESVYSNPNNAGQQSRGWKLEYRIFEKDGKKHVEQTQSMRNLLRYQDQILYQADFDELLTMPLPATADLTSGIDDTKDLGFDAWLERIPQGIRTLGWTMLSSAAGTQLQQRDDEPDTAYSARRTSGDLGLALIRTALFDIDRSDGWLTFASDDTPSLKGELRIRARTNSGLSKDLLESAGASRFAPILGDQAAVTLHVCTRLPEEAPPALIALSELLNETGKAEAAGNPGQLESVRSLSSVLTGIAEHRNLEILLKLGWTQESAGVIYGGLQLTDDPALLQSLYRLLTEIPADLPDSEQQLQLVEDSGQQFIRIQLPEEAVEEIRSSTGMTLSHLWIGHDNSCLWFAIGSEQAKEIIRQSIARCSAAGRAARTPLFSFKIDMERWLAYPQDDPTGIAGLPWFLDEHTWWFPPGPQTMFMMSRSGASDPSPIMQRVFDLGGDQQFWLTLEADDSGLLLKSSLGLALANHMAARMITAQEAMMNSMRQEAEQATRKAAEAAKAAAEPSATPAPAQ